MKNTIYFDAEFAPLLLVNEEQVGSNSIVINIEADSTANQSLLVTMDSGTTTSLTVTPGQENSLAIDEAYWSLSGSTFVSLVKGGLTSNSITLIFPETINTDAALEETSNLTYTMTGSNTVTEQIDDLDDRVTALEQGGESEKEVYYGTTLPTVDIGQDSSLYYKIIQRPEDLKTLNVVEYIQSARGTYIPTDILLTNNTRIMMRGIFYYGAYNGGTVAFGTEGRDLSNNVGRFVVGTSEPHTVGNCYFIFGNDTAGYSRNCEGIYETDVMLIADTVTKTFAISGGGTSHSATVPSGFLYTSSSTPLGILCANTSSEAGGFSTYIDDRKMNANAIIKRFQVYENNVLSYDLIPVQNANDVTDCGLYDRIHRKYYSGVNINSNIPFTAGTPTGEVINQLDECVEAGYLRVDDEWWEIYNGGTEYFAGNYIEITTNNVITSTLKAGTNIQIADDGTISASAAEIVQTVTSGTQLATINGTSIYAPTVSASQTLASGTEIGSVTVGSTSTTLYAPTPQSVSASQTLASGTEIGSITIDNTTTTLYAPGGGGSDVTVTPKVSTGTNIADISVDGTTYQLFAPSSGGGGGSGSGYTETSLWSGTQTTTGTITLSDSIQNYDAIIFRWSPHRLSTDYCQQTAIILTSSITLGSIYQYLLSSMIVNNQYSSSALCHFEDYTHFTLDEINVSTYFPVFALLEIVGLKFGGGSSGHNYSTTEQVVGTWIDGSTVYEKTQYGGITFSAAGTWYNTDITNIDKLVSVQGSINRDGAPINIGYWTSSIVSCWILRDHTLKMAMQAKPSGETFTLNSITVRYTKSS